jgi:glycerol-3-phosphate dehydrogenase
MNLENIDKHWDLVVIGGGITGAGILREAVRMGLKTILVEKNDFAWGTSSRSSKFIHGGLRYLAEGKIFLTYDSVRHRQRLLREAPGLVDPVDFLVPVYEGIRPGRWALEAALSIYDLMAGEKHHSYYELEQFSAMIPQIQHKKLTGGYLFMDAQTDDARLVLRLINEAVAAGGTALNYTGVTRIKRNKAGMVTAVAVRDTETGQTEALVTPAVINATGAWAEELHPSPKKHLHLRPLRGSHLLFPDTLLPIKKAVTLVHPEDKRPMFIFPWEGVLLLGTTDLDYEEPMSQEPVITRQEADYLMTALTAYFPRAKIRLKDAVSSIAGVRPVLSKGDRPPSKESREYVVWIKKGLITVTGGKLTTFRSLAKDALSAAKPFLPGHQSFPEHEPAFHPAPETKKPPKGLSPESWRRLCGRYGAAAEKIVARADAKDLKPIENTFTLWAELPLLAETEEIRHLSDLMLRRVRIGLLTTGGGRHLLDRVQALCEPVLDWDKQRWKKERKDYIAHWEYAHGVPK